MILASVRFLAVRSVVAVVAVVAVAVAACTPIASTTPRPVADPRASRDPINRLSLPHLEAHAQTILDELVAALPADKRAQVEGVTLAFDNAMGDVNAYATCGTTGPIVAVSDGLLLIAAHIAMSVATDETFETTKKSEYFDHLSQKGTQPPPPGFYAPAFHTDRTKVARQRELFDEQVAYILGHELAHHYLGHLGCHGETTIDGVPLFDQSTELASDVAAVKNLLAAGARRAGYAWTEDGALFVLAAFQHRTELRSILFAFERSHPLPVVRMPLVTSAADLWRLTSEYAPGI